MTILTSFPKRRRRSLFIAQQFSTQKTWVITTKDATTSFCLFKLPTLDRPNTNIHRKQDKNAKHATSDGNNKFKSSDYQKIKGGKQKT